MRACAWVPCAGRRAGCPSAITPGATITTCGSLSPSPALIKAFKQANDERAWRVFARKFRQEMSMPDAARLLDLLAALSRQTNFSVGCYSDNEARCHRSILRALLAERGASFGDT